MNERHTGIRDSETGTPVSGTDRQDGMAARNPDGKRPCKPVPCWTHVAIGMSF